MILTPHMLVGAAIGAKISQPWLVLILSIIGHYLMDAAPHWDYRVTHLKKPENWAFLKKDYLRHFSKVVLDFFTGLIIISAIVWSKDIVQKNLIIFAVAASLLPDGLQFLYWSFKTKYLKPFNLLNKKIHHKGVFSFIRGFPLQLLIALAATAILVFAVS